VPYNIISSYPAQPAGFMCRCVGWRSEMRPSTNTR